MQLIEIDIIGAQIGQALFQSLTHISRGGALIIVAVANLVADFRGDDHGIPAAAKSFTEDAFRFSGRKTIVVGCVEEVDTGVQRSRDHFEGFFLVEEPAEIIAAKTGNRDL